MSEWIVSDEDYAGDSFYYGKPLVRCKECKFFSDDDLEAVCHAHNINLSDTDGFCWLGEKGTID